MKSAREAAREIFVALFGYDPGEGRSKIDDRDVAKITAAVAARDEDHAKAQTAEAVTAIGLLANEVATYGHHDAECFCDACEFLATQVPAHAPAVAPGPGEGAATCPHGIRLARFCVDCQAAELARTRAAAPPVAPAPPDEQQISKADLAEAKRRADKLFGPDPVAPAETPPPSRGTVWRGTRERDSAPATPPVAPMTVKVTTRNASPGEWSYDGSDGGHKYDEHGTSDCAFGCGCWAGRYSSDGPEGIDPLGACPKNPQPRSPDVGTEEGT